MAVDDVAWSSSNWINKDTGASYNTDCASEWEVYTTDTNLNSALVAISGIDTDNDGVITYEEAQVFTGDLDLSGQGITNVIGLAAFSNAASINISGNDITDISSLLNASNVIVSSRTSGERQTRARTEFTGLQTLDVSNNKIENIDISELSSLNTLTTLNVSNNNLKYLNINNGHNISLTTFNATGNPDLTCIQVDNVDKATNEAGWSKDNSASYNTFCSRALSVDQNQLKEFISVYPNPVNSILNIEVNNQIKIEKIQLFNIVGKLVKEEKEVNQLSVNQLVKGMYLLKITTDKGVLTQKILKK